MKRSEEKATTTLRQQIKWFFIALAVGAAAFVLTYQAGMFLISHHMSGEEYQNNNRQTYLEPFSKYVKENAIKSSDAKAINEWVNDTTDVAVKIFDSSGVIYENYYFDFTRRNYSMMEFMHTGKLEYLTTYPVEFADGTYSVYINRAKADRIYFSLLFLTTIIGIAAFCSAFLAGITRRSKYITQLKTDIEILGSGDLHHQIKIRGNDDLTYIAENLEQMRLALLEHMEEEDRLAKGNKEMVSKLSHDIRTPVTSMMLFADLLKDGKYRDEMQRDHFIERIRIGAEHLTELTDQLLEYTRNERSVHFASRSVEIDLSPLVDRAVEELKIRGFNVEVSRGDGAVSVEMEASSAVRIMDNIVSNIIRYADNNEPVKISCRDENQTALLEFSNGIDATEQSEESTCVGLNSIETIMKQAGGRVKISTECNCFSVRLLFNKATKRGA